MLYTILKKMYSPTDGVDYYQVIATITDYLLSIGAKDRIFSAFKEDYVIVKGWSESEYTTSKYSHNEYNKEIEVR